MYLLILGVGLIILSIIGYLIYEKLTCFDLLEDVIIIITIILVIIGSIISIICITLLIYKPLDYKSFKTEYNVIKNINSSESDLRDVMFTEKIIKINTKINYCKEFYNSKWIGLYIDKRICKFEELNKERDKE